MYLGGVFIQGPAEPGGPSGASVDASDASADGGQTGIRRGSDACVDGGQTGLSGWRSVVRSDSDALAACFFIFFPTVLSCTEATRRVERGVQLDWVELSKIIRVYDAVHTSPCGRFCCGEVGIRFRTPASAQSLEKIRSLQFLST